MSAFGGKADIMPGGMVKIYSSTGRDRPPSRALAPAVFVFFLKYFSPNDSGPGVT